MKWKTTLVLLVITVGVGAYVSLVDLKQPTPDEQQARSMQIVNVPPGEVTGLSVQTSSITASLERQGDSWRLTAPASLRADDTLLQRILNELAPLTADRMLTGSKDKPLNPADFGLVAPEGTLSVIAGPKSMTLLLGTKTAVGEKRYAKPADHPAVSIVPGQLFDMINQPIEAWRSYDLLDFETWKAGTITVNSPRSAYTLAKQPVQADTPGGPDRWRVTRPFDDVADAGTASTLISKLRNLHIEHVETDEAKPEDVATWGFDQPYAHLVIDIPGGKQQRLEVWIGKPAAQQATHRYAKRTDEPSIYTVRQDAIDEILKEPDALRSPVTMDIQPEQARRIEWRSGPRTWAMVRDSGQWMIAETNSVLDQDAAKGHAWALHDLKFTRAIQAHPQGLPQAGLDPAVATVLVTTSQSPQPQELRIGNPISQGQARYGYLPSRDLLVELPDTADSLLQVTPESLAPKPPEPPPAAEPTATPQDSAPPAQSNSQ